MAAGNVFRIKKKLRIGQSTAKSFRFGATELTGSTFTISSGIFSLIDSTGTKKITDKSVSVLTPAIDFELPFAATDTDILGEYLMVITLTMDNGDEEVIQMDVIIIDPEAEAIIP